MSGGAGFLPSTVPPEMVCGLGMFLVFLCEKKLVVQGILGIIQPSCVWIIVQHSKDPY